MKKPTLEQIKLYLDSGEWSELLPTYQEECIKWLMDEFQRLRHLTSCSSRAAVACAHGKSCSNAVAGCIIICTRYKPPSA